MDFFRESTPPNFIPFCLGEQNTENVLTPDEPQVSSISAAESHSHDPIQVGQTQRSTGSVDRCHQVC